MEQEGKISTRLKNSLPVNYHITVTASRSTDYVMIEVPIPSSCFYGDKTVGRMPQEVNREYFDDKVVIFCRNLPRGEHKLMINLQPRFEGRSTLLPVKVSMMYYPDCYGINTKQIVFVY
jgi:alpha-2-macroglobulin